MQSFLFIYLLIYLFIYLFIHLFIYVYMYLFIYFVFGTMKWAYLWGGEGVGGLIYGVLWYVYIFRQLKVGAQNQNYPNRDIKFSDHKITGKDSICSKQLKSKEKEEE